MAIIKITDNPQNLLVVMVDLMIFFSLQIHLQFDHN